MTNKDILKSYLLDVLENTDTASGGTEIICKCNMPGCDDTKRHLYIGPFNDDDSPVRYHCFKCECGGFVDRNFLEKYGVSDINQEALSQNIAPRYNSINIKQERIYNVTNNYITDCNVSRIKLQYINDRLGLNLSYQDCINNKIVLNLGDLLYSNHINKYTRHIEIIKQINQYFIGFLSRSNSSLNMRNLNEGKVYESIDKKYINYKIFDSNQEDDFYIIPSYNIDLRYRIKVHIAEGAFDILGVYYNVVRDKSNSIFIAGKGKAYEAALTWLILSNGIYNLDVHYYVDKDVKDSFIETIRQNFYVFKTINFFMHRNMYPGEKDYGVPKDRIVDKMVKL